jgi:outer membrane protein assembly factor BamB
VVKPFVTQLPHQRSGQAPTPFADPNGESGTGRRATSRAWFPPHSGGENVWACQAKLRHVPAGSAQLIDWQVADPNGAIDLAPLTVSNGVVYAASMAGTATAPNMLALNAATSNTPWSLGSASSVIAGASIANDTVYWGSGYTNLPIPGFTGNNKLYAFNIGGQ